MQKVTLHITAILLSGILSIPAYAVVKPDAAVKTTTSTPGVVTTGKVSPGSDKQASSQDKKIGWHKHHSARNTHTNGVAAKAQVK